MNAAAPIFDDLTTLSDVTRSRMLLLLDRNELTVSELLFGAAAPAIHGEPSSQDADGRRVAVFAARGDEPLLHADARRPRTRRAAPVDAAPGTGGEHRRGRSGRPPAQGGHRASASRSRASSSIRRRASGTSCARSCSDASAALQALPALLDPALDGRRPRVRHRTGRAPRSRRSSAASSRSTGPARCCRPHAAGCASTPTSRVRRGDLEALPIADGELDVASLMLVLHHLAEPGAALREAARTLKPGGRLLICDMLPHDREEYRQQMGHVWLGFAETQVAAPAHGRGIRRHAGRAAADQHRRERPGALRRERHQRRSAGRQPCNAT